MKKKISIAVVSFIVLAAGLYLYTAKYNINEIEANNFGTLLKTNNKSILLSQLDKAIPDKLPFIVLYEAMDSDNSNGEGYKIINEKYNSNNILNVHSYLTNLNYKVIYDNKTAISAWVFKDRLHDLNSPENPRIRNIINDLIYNYGFTLKKNNLKNSFDIIIKETEDSFIIGSFYSIEEQPLTNNITFQSFSKTKYPFL